MAKQIAHYYCELAENDWEKGRVRSAFKSLRRGFSYDKQGLRPHLLKAHFEIKLGKYQRAEKTLKNVQIQEKKLAVHIGVQKH